MPGQKAFVAHAAHIGRRERQREPEAKGLARKRPPCRPGYDDDSFDLVTGFTSFFFAETWSRRCAKPARRASRRSVVIQVFGRPELCDLEAMKGAVKPFRPAAASGEAAKTYWRLKIAEELAEQAGLIVEGSFDSTWAYGYADDDALLHAMLPAGGAGAIAGPERERELAGAICARSRTAGSPTAATASSTNAS